VHPIERADKRGFAAARGTDQRHDAPVGDRKIRVLDRLEISVKTLRSSIFILSLSDVAAGVWIIKLSR
jgi:hypothetical protein